MEKQPGQFGRPSGADRVWFRSRREAYTILSILAMLLVWTVGYCRLAGYRDGAVTVTLGMPSWVFWGVLVPWLVAMLMSCWYSLCVMSDEDLEEGCGESCAAGGTAGTTTTDDAP